jgi:hypothetical protein
MGTTGKRGQRAESGIKFFGNDAIWKREGTMSDKKCGEEGR